MTVGERIKARRKELGFSVDDLAAKLGKNRATVYRYENGEIENLPTTVLEPLAKALLTTPADLMGWEGLYGIQTATTTTYPLLGEVACGEPIIANDQHEVFTTERRINADAVVIASGDSMIGARINDGDVVFIRYQEDVENGEIAAVLLENLDTEDAEIVLKRFYKYGDDLVVLRSENPSYKDIEIRAEEHRRVKVIGKAIAFQSDIV